MRYFAATSLLFLASIAFVVAHLIQIPYAGSELIAWTALAILIAGAGTGLLFDCFIASFALLLAGIGHLADRASTAVARHL